MTPPYRVIPIGEPARPDAWNVCHPDGRVLRPINYPHQRQAQALADLLNEAWRIGRSNG
jgi:hypothetical protein